MVRREAKAGLCTLELRHSVTKQSIQLSKIESKLDFVDVSLIFHFFRTGHAFDSHKSYQNI